MPTAKTLSYDHDAYQSPLVFSAPTAAGATGLTTKFAAFTSMQIRRVVMASITAGTSATTPLLFSKSGTATTTTTLGTAIGSAAVTAVDNVLATAISLAQGDSFWASHGTDATIVAGVAIECYVTPGASLACP